MRYFLYNFELFFLVFTRLFGMLAVAPLFSSSVLTPSLRAMLAFTVSIVVFPIVTRQPPHIPDGMYLYGAMAASELLIGIIIGFLASIFFSVFQMAGQFFSLQIGLSISEVLDPISQEEIPVIGQFLTLIGTLVFVAIGGERFLLDAVVRSFQVLPVLDFSNPELMKRLTDGFVSTTGQMFVLSLKLSMPLMGTLTILMISLALLSKAAPMMNIFMVGFPVQLAVGFVSLILIAPMLGSASAIILEIMHREILNLLGALS